MTDTDTSGPSGPGCDDVEFGSANYKIRGGAGARGGRADLRQFDVVADEIWEEDDDFGAFEEDDEPAGTDMDGERDESPEEEDEGEFIGDGLDYDEDDAEPDWEDAEFQLHVQMHPLELAAKGAESVEWKLLDLYNKPFNTPANKGMKDEAVLGGVSVLTLRNSAPFSVAYRMSLPEDAAHNKKRGLKKAESRFSIENDRIRGGRYLGEHVPIPVHGVLAPAETMDVEVPCLTSPAQIDESFLSKENKGHWTIGDMTATENGVHRYKSKPGVVCLEPDHPVAKLAETYYRENVDVVEDHTEVSEKDFNKYTGMLITQHKAFMTLGDARKNLSIHFTRHIPPSSSKSSRAKSLKTAWTDETEICDSISTADPAAFEKAKNRALDKTYTITGTVLVQFAPRRLPTL